MKKLVSTAEKITKHRILILFVLLLSYFGGYFLCDRINYYHTTYECAFIASEDIDETVLLSEENLLKIRDSAEKYSEIDIAQMLGSNGIYLLRDDRSYSIVTKTRYYQNFFVKSSATVSTRAKKFLEDLLIITYGKDEIEFKDPDIIQLKGYMNPYLFGSLTTAVCFAITITVIILSKNEKSGETTADSFYDNIDVYRSPFHLSYWKKSMHFFSSVKNIASIAMLLALMLTSKMLILPSGFGNLGLSFGFIFFSIACILYGPLCGLIVGFLSDILGFFLFDTSGTAFFIGYVFQAMVTGIIYGLMLYRTRLTFFRIFLTRLLIALISNVIVGSLSWGFVAGYNWEQTFSYMVLLSLPKNLVYLIPQSLLLFVVIRFAIPPLTRFGAIDTKIAKNISWI